MRCAMPQPCIGSRARVLRIRRSKVPWTKSVGLPIVAPLNYRQVGIPLFLSIVKRKIFHCCLWRFLGGGLGHVAVEITRGVGMLELDGGVGDAKFARYNLIQQAADDFTFRSRHIQDSHMAGERARL